MDVILYKEHKLHSVERNVLQVDVGNVAITIIKEVFAERDNQLPERRFEQVVYDKEQEGITTVDVRE